MRMSSSILKRLRLWRAMSSMKASAKVGREASEFGKPYKMPPMRVSPTYVLPNAPGLRKVWRRFGKEMVRA